MIKKFDENKYMLFAVNVLFVFFLFIALDTVFNSMRFLILFYKVEYLWQFYSSFHTLILFLFIFTWLFSCLKVKNLIFRK